MARQAGPPIADVERFPSGEAVGNLIAFNRSYYQRLEARQQMEPMRHWSYQTIITETQQLYTVWETLRDARCESYYVSVRRAALKKLREQIGPDAYYSGLLPPHVPLWRFREVGP